MNDDINFVSKQVFKAVLNGGFAEYVGQELARATLALCYFEMDDSLFESVISFIKGNISGDLSINIETILNDMYSAKLLKNDPDLYQKAYDSFNENFLIYMIQHSELMEIPNKSDCFAFEQDKNLKTLS